MANFNCNLLKVGRRVQDLGKIYKELTAGGRGGGVVNFI